MKKQILNGLWEMQEVGSSERYPVTVPGTVLSCLLTEGIVEDPYYRKNEYATRDLFWKDYQFTRSFEVCKELLSEDMVELVCESLDTFAEISINGTRIAKTDNMHRTWRISVKEYLKEGSNTISILFRSPLEYAKNYKSPENKAVHYVSPVTTKNNEMIRKAHSMFGWDWGAQLVDAGIQREVRLEAYSFARIQDVRITQQHEKNCVRVRVHTETAALSGTQQLRVTLTAPDGSSNTLRAKPCRTEETTKNRIQTGEMPEIKMTRLPDGRIVSLAEADVEFEVENPELWWPNGYGEHPLYGVEVVLEKEDGQEERKTFRIGLRTLTISQEKDQWGSEFAFCVNGVKIFAMGANYIPEDCVYPRITKEKLENLIKASVRANYNCLRHWGGGYYPSDTFYDLCDEYGLIVWQDLMFACNTYEFHEEFEKNVVEEIKDNVRRLRHHACLGLWCGNNELETAWVNWTDFDGCSIYMREDYIRQFEYVMPKLMKELDPDTFYWHSSPSSGGCFDDPNAENRGDVHYWEVWHGQKPFTDYRNYYFRFCSEFGFQSFPCPKTVYTYTEPEDRNIFSDVMESHQKNSSANGKILYYLSENFRYPRDFESLLYVSQVLQAIAMKYGVEHWRRNRGRCMGALYWQLNDEWPVASWSSIDYFGRWKALHYFARNFFAPLTGSLERHGNLIKVYLENETFETAECEVEFCLKNMELEVLDYRRVKGAAPALSANKVLEIDYTKLLEEYDPQEVICTAVFTYADGRIQRETESFVPYKHLKLKKADIRIAVKEEADRYEISLSSDVFANYVALELTGADGIFSDNYVAITGKDPVMVTLKKADITNGNIENAEALEKALQTCSIRDSYV